MLFGKQTVLFFTPPKNKIKNLENGGKVEQFYRLHYPHYVFDEKILLIGDIMRFLQKCPELPLPPLSHFLEKYYDFPYLDYKKNTVL